MKTVNVVMACLACVLSSFVNAQSSPGTTTQSTSVAPPSAAPAPSVGRQQNEQQRRNSRRQTQPQQPQQVQPKEPAQPAPPQQPPVQQQPQEPTIEQPPATTPPKNVRRRANRPNRGISQPPAVSFDQARRKQHRERHDRPWWTIRYTTIVFVHNCGYYYLDAGYWFPALGYDPGSENFDYSGPIYTYGNLLPDQVIYNVQRALKELGYYDGPLNSSLGPGTRAAISAFQEDNDLEITGVIDAPTVEALGLN